jgi:hypothetical protein
MCESIHVLHDSLRDSVRIEREGLVHSILALWLSSRLLAFEMLIWKKGKESGGPEGFEQEKMRLNQFTCEHKPLRFM